MFPVLHDNLMPHGAQVICQVVCIVVILKQCESISMSTILVNGRPRKASEAVLSVKSQYVKCASLLWLRTILT